MAQRPKTLLETAHAIARKHGHPKADLIQIGMVDGCQSTYAPFSSHEYGERSVVRVTISTESAQRACDWYVWKHRFISKNYERRSA